MGMRTTFETRQLARIGGICAVVAALLTVLNVFVLAAGGPRDLHLTAAEIVTGATGGHDGVALGACVDAFGAGLFVVFVLVVGRLAEPKGGLLSSVAGFTAAVFFAIDVAWAATRFAFAESVAQNVDPSSVKALYLLTRGLLLVIAMPIALQYAALGLLIVKTRVLPAIMGWIAFVASAVALGSLVAGIYGRLRALGFVAFILAGLLWPLVAGILLVARAGRVESSSSGAPVAGALHELPDRMSASASLAADAGRLS